MRSKTRIIARSQRTKFRQTLTNLNEDFIFLLYNIRSLNVGVIIRDPAREIILLARLPALISRDSTNSQYNPKSNFHAYIYRAYRSNQALHGRDPRGVFDAFSAQESRALVYGFSHLARRTS